MKKFVLMYAYMTKDEIGYVRGPYRPLAVANDLNTLMKSVEGYAQGILKVPNNVLHYDKWDMRLDGSHAEILVTHENGVQFIIDQVNYLV